MSTPFAEMPQRSLNGWKAWCASHSWSDQASWYDDMTGEMVTYGVDVTQEDGFRIFVTEARHKTPRDLKNWAGY